MILTEINIHQIIADRGIDWLIDNTKKIIIRYSKQKKDYKYVVKRYSKLLTRIYAIKEQMDKDGVNYYWDKMKK